MIPRFLTRSIAIVVALLVLGALNTPALAQAPFDEEQPLDQRTIEIVSLEHAEAGEVAATVLEMAPKPLGFSLTIDERTNSMIVATNSDTAMPFVSRIVKLLDVPIDSEGAYDVVVRVFKLKNPEVGHEVVDLIAEVFPPRGQQGRLAQLPLRVAFDASTGQIVARGVKGEMTALQALIEDLDRPSADERPGESPAQTELLVRLVWLVGGLNEGQGRAVPADLAPVLAELRRLGIDDLRLGAQVLVRTSDSRKFSTQFGARLADRWAMSFDGIPRAATGDRRFLDVSIDGRAIKDGGESIQLSTSIVTVAGHLVVLSTGPIGELESVFVIQVTNAG
jgi:hypothetical protein